MITDLWAFVPNRNVKNYFWCSKKKNENKFFKKIYKTYIFYTSNLVISKVSK